MSGGLSVRESPRTETPCGNKRAVRILLECILVYHIVLISFFIISGILLVVIFVPFSTPIPPNLVTYDGENKQLTVIPDDIPANVEHLKLSSNRITEITANAFSNFDQLRYLDLSSNLISSIELGAFNGLKAPSAPLPPKQ